MLEQVAKAQVQNRRVQYFRGPTKSEDRDKQQWELGEASGMETLMRLPHITIEANESIIKESLQNETGKTEQSP